MTTVYETKGGYYYKKTKYKTKRISKSDYEKYKGKKPIVGDKVKIIIKPYNKKNYQTGIVKRVLTKKKYHSRGFKVELKNGMIGRVKIIL